MTTTSASTASSVASKPACSSSPAMRSESWTFIWQPNVSIRYLRATRPHPLCVLRSLCGLDRLRVLCSLCVLRVLATFAFAFRFRHQHLTGGAPKTIGHRLTAQHPREFLDTAIRSQPLNGRVRPASHHALLDGKVRIRERGNLRE